MGTSAVKLMALGLGLLLAAWLVILLMVIRSIPPNLALAVAAYAASLTGLVLGLFGGMQYIRGRSRHDGSDQ